MAHKNKLQKFEDILHYPNVLESYDRLSSLLSLNEEVEKEMSGKWAFEQFGNQNPITLELACGKGDYTLGLAKRFPAKNFIGVDIKGNRIWKGATLALEQKLSNVAFLRTRIENISQHFQKYEVQDIWITFPDPFPRKSKANKRLTSPRFLSIYRQFLHPDGLIRLKTDAQDLFAWTEEVWSESKDIEIVEIIRDVYANPEVRDELAIQTFYEKQHLAKGRTISFIAGKLTY